MHFRSASCLAAGALSEDDTQGSGHAVCMMIENIRIHRAGKIRVVRGKSVCLGKMSSVGGGVQYCSCL